MELSGFVLLWIIIGVVTGVLATLVVRAATRKLWLDIIVGLVGASSSGFVSYIHDGPKAEHSVPSSMITAFVGASLLLFLLRIYNFRQDSGEVKP